MNALGECVVEKPAKANAKNLETIIRAANDGALAVLECTLKTTGEKCAVLAAVSKAGNGYSMTPFCVFLNGNPYELLEPPKP